MTDMKKGPRWGDEEGGRYYSRFGAAVDRTIQQAREDISSERNLATKFLATATYSAFFPMIVIGKYFALDVCSLIKPVEFLRNTR